MVERVAPQEFEVEAVLSHVLGCLEIIRAIFKDVFGTPHVIYVYWLWKVMILTHIKCERIGGTGRRNTT